MIGIIVTGHGNFADGLLSASQVIVGAQEHLCAVNFPSGDTTENLRAKLERAVKDMDCKTVLFLTDLMGGTPFNQSAMIAEAAAGDCRVISGTNLPALIAAIFGRTDGDVAALANSLLASDEAKLHLYTSAKRTKSAQSAGGI